MSGPRLNRRLILEKLVSVPDGAGGYSESWYAMGILWGELRPRSGRESSTDGAVTSVSGFRIVVRAAPKGFSNRPEAGQRFRHKDRRFRIQAVSEIEPACIYLSCTAEEELVT